MNSPFGILNRKSLKNISIDTNPTAVCLGDIVRVHDSNYIGEIRKIWGELSEDELIEYDADTHISKETWRASVYSAGACIEAARKVMNKTTKNAFCCVRPPGHHAGVYGKVEVDKEELSVIKSQNPTYTLTQ